MFQIRKAFAKLLTHSRALWWFDMWGGWYHCAALMDEMKRYRQIGAMETAEFLPRQARFAIIVDETYYRAFPGSARMQDFCRRAAFSGFMFDIYLLTDLEKVLADYPLLFVPYAENCTVGSPKLVRGMDQSLAEIIERCKATGLSPLAAPGDVTFAGNGFVALHAVTGGEKEITLSRKMKVTALTDQPISVAENRVRVLLKKYDTVILKCE